MMPDRLPWYWRLDANPVVVTISTIAALVTIASYQWQATEARLGDARPAATVSPTSVGGSFDVEPASPTRRTGGESALPVEMTLPRGGQAVDEFTDMSFDMIGEVPPGYTPVAYVRDPLRQYWSFGSIAPGAPKRVQVGTRDDRRREFEIGIWITNQEPPRGEPFDEPPGNVGHAAVKVLRR